MGDADGPAVECLKGELEKARNAAKRRLLQQEVEECRKFITRSEKRISELDAERLSEMKALDEAKERGAAGSRAGRSPKGLISAGNRAPCGLGCRGPEATRGIDASARRSQSHSRCTILPKFLRGCQFAAGEGCKTSCRSCRVGAHQSTRCGTVVVRKTSGAPRCHRVWGQRVASGVDGSDAARCSAVPQFAFHCEQHGCVRIVAHQCGWLGFRVGEAANPGPASRRRRMRALPWSWDSDTESDDEGRNVVRRLESHVDSDEEPLLPPSSPPEEVIRALEADLCSPPCATRRVMLIPQSQGGTPTSIQDARETLPSEVDLPSTFPASSGAVRRLVLVSNSQEDRSTVPSMDMVYNSARSPQEAPGDAGHSDCGRNV